MDPVRIATIVAAIVAAVLAAAWVVVWWWWWRHPTAVGEPFDAGGAFAKPAYRPPPVYSYVMDVTVPWAAEAAAKVRCPFDVDPGAGAGEASPREVTFELSDDELSGDAVLAAQYRELALGRSREWVRGRSGPWPVVMSECVSRVRVAPKSGRAYVDVAHVVGPVDDRYVTTLASVVIRSLDDVDVSNGRCVGTVSGDRVVVDRSTPTGAAVFSDRARFLVKRDDPALVAGVWTATAPAVTRVDWAATSI